MAVSYRISLYPNGGSGSTQTITGSVSSTPASVSLASASRPTKTYYTFNGWSSSSSATSGSMTATIPSGVTGTYVKALYAAWTPAKANLYYNANGGSGAPSTQTVNQYTWFNLSSTEPTRSGYIFLGWGTSASATTASYQPGDLARIVSNMTLYAVWQAAASTLSASNGTIGSAMTLTINRNSSSYTHTIDYQFGSASGTIATKTSSASVSWTPPTTLASQIPNASSGTCTFTIYTYNGNTLLGSSTKSVTLSVPSSLSPTVSVSVSDANTTCSGWGVYVQSRSRLSISISASGQQGTSISSYSTTVNGSTYTSSSFTTDVLLNSGTNNYTTVVIDSRGKKTTKTGSISVVAYANPSAIILKTERNDSDSTQIDVRFDYTISSVSNNNAKKYALDYKLKSASTWTTGTQITLSSYSDTITASITGTDDGSDYDVRVRIIDSFSTISVTSDVGASGNIILNSRHSGGIGIGMKSQASNRIDLGHPSVFHSTVDVIERRAEAELSSSGWYRVLTVTPLTSSMAQGGLGIVYDINIVRRGQSVSAESHSIRYRSTNDGNGIWTGEESFCGSSQYITKIRYTYDSSNNVHIDIYYSGTSANYVTVFYSAYLQLELQGRIVSNNLTSVADAPSGETILTTYTFKSNTTLAMYQHSTFTANITDYGTQKLAVTCDCYRLGNLGFAFINPSSNSIYGLSFNTLLQIENLPFTAISASGFVRSLGSGQDGMDCWQMSSHKIYLRKVGGGNLTGTFTTNPILSVLVVGIY